MRKLQAQPFPPSIRFKYMLFHSGLHSFQAWKTSEPSTTSDSDHCARVSSTVALSGSWAVTPCSAKLPALCQRAVTSFTGDEEQAAAIEDTDSP